MIGISARSSILTCVAFLLATGGVAARADDAPLTLVLQQEQVFEAALAQIGPCIVRIETVGGALPVASGKRQSGEEVARPLFRQADGPTTGVIWTADGYVVSSSFNFMRDPTVITVTLADGRRFVARLVARDRAARLALLKIDANDLPTPTLRERVELRRGVWALVAGYGQGSRLPAVSVGIISATQRMNGLALQTDAKTSPANYGGPLFDTAGRLLGVVVPMGPGEGEIAGVEWYDSGIGFAIGCDVIAERLPRLRQGEDLQPGKLGVALAGTPALSEAGAAFVARETGAAPPPPLEIVADPIGPAAEAGLQKGDKLTALAGTPLSEILDLRRALARKAAGDAVEITFERDGGHQTVTLTLALEEDLRSPGEGVAPEGPPAPPATQPAEDGAAR